MKKTLLFTFLIIAFIASAINFDIGMSILTGKDNWNMGLRLGLDENNFEFLTDISYVNEPELSFITLIDVSTSILKISDTSNINFGVAWFNDRITKDATENRSIYLLYSGLKLNMENISLKAGFGYPLSQETYSTNLSDYMFFKITYIVPPPEDFIDDLKLEFRFLNGRKDFSIYFSEPIQ
ncbi:hypothetical protein XO10_07680 [Marinitoga sp. 1135]|uniref:Uncharacterized protein n=1 Tax=Marinitoga piezophila (strain DSM 14283 / JCM 11233 / KA3) TaxID=443254 RepID=H2J4K6_MARPK|nr:MULTISPECIES: hypothetical protein [Marinitoga]AEX85948.1 hypothetical protein Marpi_1558 [Marinitoga piezophila KA3]APT76376.1 hypothetical protein LN42_08300 [Marinitoga sp. 1137]NUU96146.1 hypothetical protein [Marinitoga sp. 1135]NUU98054.1 hypothetical protein [Marinitoga sp. 1138]